MAFEVVEDLFADAGNALVSFLHDPFENVINELGYPSFNGDYSLESQLAWAQLSYEDDMRMREALIELQSALAAQGIFDEKLNYYVNVYENIRLIWSEHLDSNEKVQDSFIVWMNNHGGIDEQEGGSANTQYRIVEYVKGLRTRVTDMA